MLHEQSQPIYLEGYHRPDYRSPDDQVYDAIADLMSSGRPSRLYRALVRDKQIASDAEGFTGYPGNKYPQLFAFYASPLPGHKPQEIGDAIHAEIDRLKKEDISDEELRMITKADIRRVANQTFNPENRTVGIIDFVGGPPPGVPAAPQRGGQ